MTPQRLHPLVRLVLGLAIGFLGAIVTLEAIDRFGPTRSGERFETVLGRPDFAGWCERDGSGLELVVFTDDPDGYRCSGPIEGLYGTREIDVDQVCRWQYAGGAQVRSELFGNTQDGWRCVRDP